MWWQFTLQQMSIQVQGKKRNYFCLHMTGWCKSAWCYLVHFPCKVNSPFVLSKWTSMNRGHGYIVWCIDRGPYSLCQLLIKAQVTLGTLLFPFPALPWIWTLSMWPWLFVSCRRVGKGTYFWCYLSVTSKQCHCHDILLTLKFNKLLLIYGYDTAKVLCTALDSLGHLYRMTPAKAKRTHKIY